MAIKASLVKKFRRWINSRAESKWRVSKGYQNLLSQQVGKLLASRGSEIITMTTL